MTRDATTTTSAAQAGASGALAARRGALGARRRRAARAAGLLDAAARLLPPLPRPARAHGPLGDLDARADELRRLPRRPGRRRRSCPSPRGRSRRSTRSSSAGPTATNLLRRPTAQACQKCHTDYRQVSPERRPAHPAPGARRGAEDRTASSATRTSCTRPTPGLQQARDGDVPRPVPRRRQGDQRVRRSATRASRRPTATRSKDWLAGPRHDGRDDRLRQVPRLDAGLLRRLPQEAARLARRQLEEGPRGRRQGSAATAASSATTARSSARSATDARARDARTTKDGS